MKQEAGNEVLAALLMELGWSPRALARRINRVSGVGTVAETAPYHWRDAGRVPRPPLPALAAWVLSRELGRPVTIAELWQGHAADSPLTLPADVEMDQPWTRAGALSIIDDWVMSGLLDRRLFLTVSASALTALASGYPASAPGSLPRALDGQPAGHPLLDQIEQSIPLLQRLDDANGGGTHLAYVGAQFRAVALLVRQGGHPDPVDRRLFAALAEIGQLAGWMAVDAGRKSRSRAGPATRSPPAAARPQLPAQRKPPRATRARHAQAENRASAAPYGRRPAQSRPGRESMR